MPWLYPFSSYICIGGGDCINAFPSKVCCTDTLSRLPDPNVTEEPNVTETPNVTEEPEEPDDSFTVLSDLLPTPDICKVKLAKRIVGGKKTLEDEYPWMALLEYKKRNYNMLHLSNNHF